MGISPPAQGCRLAGYSQLAHAGCLPGFCRQARDKLRHEQVKVTFPFGSYTTADDFSLRITWCREVSLVFSQHPPDRSVQFPSMVGDVGSRIEPPQ